MNYPLSKKNIARILCIVYHIAITVELPIGLRRAFQRIGVRPRERLMPQGVTGKDHAKDGLVTRKGYIVEA